MSEIALAQSFPSFKSVWLWVVALALLLMASAVTSTIYSAVYDREESLLIQEARSTTQLQAAALRSELEKQRSVPAILAMDADIISSVRSPSEQRSLAISRKLERLQHETGSADIYVIDPTGSTLSSSNWNDPATFVGKNFSFRKYFSGALKNGLGEQFAMGSVSKHPGFFAARRIDDGAGPSGVVVVKVEFAKMEQSWRRPNTMTFVTNSADQILLTSKPALRFQRLPAPSPDQIVTAQPAIPGSWTVTVYSTRVDAIRSARAAALITVLIEILLFIALFWLWRRRVHISERATAETRYRLRLEQDVTLRTQELSEVNYRLSKEMSERQQAEGRLSELQADLIQANKLAHLGQITAGVAHEINQPVGAIGILAENCLSVIARKDFKRPNLVSDNLASIVRLIERIGHITGELRAFSRKANRETEPIGLKGAINSAILLNQSRLRENKVKLIREPFDPKLKAIGVRVRLEQVLVNLLQNAFEALEGAQCPQVRITVTVEGDWIWLRVIDNGPGLSPSVAESLFTPFVTTKEKGLGLGLVISHDIMRDFGGALITETNNCGATFAVKLRRATP